MNPPSFLWTSEHQPLCFFQILFYFLLFLGPHPWHMEAPRLGVESELQLPAYTRATATPDPRSVCDRHHSSWQHQILYPLSEARDQTCNLMVPSRICFHCTMRRELLSDFKWVVMRYALGLYSHCWQKMAQHFPNLWTSKTLAVTVQEVNRDWNECFPSKKR